MSIKTESHEFIGWYEGYHGRDGEVAELRDEIERLTAELDTMNNVHKHLATELADMGRERDQLRAALAEIANNLIDSELASSEKRWMARRALAEPPRQRP